MVKNIIGIIIMVLSIMGGLYVGGWLLFVQPIIEAFKMFDAGTLTALIVGTTVIKCVFAGTVGSIIAYVGVLIGTAFMN